ncbi:MAG: type sorting protein, partial [Bacteroidota bacterium]|nr:type sorting protein [Bacteroidota bacterium]
MKSIVITLLALILLSMTKSYSQGEIKIEDDGSVFLPEENPTYLVNYQSSASIIENQDWRAFFEKNGAWSVIIDPATRTPHRAFGKAIRIPGYDKITEDNIEQVSQAFLNTYQKILGIVPENLKLLRKTNVNNRWYVSYIQLHDGIEVLLSEIELRIFANGNISAFGSDYYSNINIPVKPSISLSQAYQKAAEGLNYDKRSDALQSDGNTYILPVKKGNNVIYKLVYQVEVTTDNNRGKYTSYVDAHSGNLVWRRNLTFNSSKISVKGMIKIKNALESEVSAPLEFHNVLVGSASSTYTTDVNGEISIADASDRFVTATFEGPYCRITREDNVISRITDTLKSGSTLNLEWNSNNCHSAERNLFYHANYIHDYYNKLDPQSKVMDFQLALGLSFNDKSPNAYSSEKTIMFVGVGLANYRFYETPGILYHEYGHSINNILFKSLGKKDGMVNSSCHEATADLFSGLVLDDPRMGKGAFKNYPDSIMRNLKNNLKYPTDLQSDSHYNGQILSGAFWDLKEVTSLEYVTKLSHFTKYGLPDDPNIGVAFGEWLLETLIADDDDGDFSNLTPHYQVIVESFDRHNIGCYLMMRASFSHTPYPDTDDTQNPYRLDFDLLTLPFGDAAGDSVYHYIQFSVDNFKTKLTAPAVKISEGHYYALIPPQKKGSFVQYFIKGYDKINKTYSDLGIFKNQENSTAEPFRFLVGYRTAFIEDFEETWNWTMGDPADKCIAGGKWELSDPEPAYYYYQVTDNEYASMMFQTGDNHSHGGRQCLVTGADSASNYMQFLNNMPV